MTRDKAQFRDEDTVDLVTGLRRLKLPEILEPHVKAYKFVKYESPWNSYEKIHEFQVGVGDLTTKAERKDLSCKVVIVRSFRGPNAKDTLQMLQRIQHGNFVSVLEVFSSEESFHVIFEHIPISLHHFANIPEYPNELQLASILGQVSSGTHNVQKLGADFDRYFAALPISYYKT
jgi:hypothetical protein